MRVFNSKQRYLYYMIIAGVLVIIAAIILIIGISSYVKNADTCRKVSTNVEAKKLLDFLNKVKTEYYKMDRQYSFHDPEVKTEQLLDIVAPYNPHPMAIKNRTDKCISLSKEFQRLNIDLRLLKPREKKAAAQLQHFLDSNFGSPYDQNYYAGDWMMGPNYFCWQPICDIATTIEEHFSEKEHGIQPKTVKDVEKIIYILKKFKLMFEQYQENMHYGVKAGMVRSEEACIAGRNVFKTNFKKVQTEGEKGILQEEFTQALVSDQYYNKISSKSKHEFREKYNGKTIKKKIQDTLVEYVGRPIVNFINYLDTNHSHYCVDSNIVSGFANLPLTNVWYDRSKTMQKTTKKLPTGENLDGKKTYEMILPYFTTSKKYTSDSIYKLGIKKRDELYRVAIELAKKLTSIKDDQQAVKNFSNYLNGPDMFFNTTEIPENENGIEGGRRCSNMEEAKKNCPVRYKAMVDWFKTVQESLALIDPKLVDMFYVTGKKATVPNCPLEMTAKFNPSSGSQSYKGSGKKCSKPGQYFLPFFLKRPGPKYGVLSVAGHEGRPGHHTQIQGFNEHFASSDEKDIIDWLNIKTYYTAFTEGWALYAENPLLSEGTDIYENNQLQKYGMLKWQLWRALRLIIDTGLHSRGMTLTESLAAFEKYTWDVTDKAYKDTIRYMASPGQATAYMIGQLAIWGMRNKTEEKLNEAGLEFDEKDFHYQILSQGSAPLDYLSNHIDDYIECKINPNSRQDYCQKILNPQYSETSKSKPIGTKQRWNVIMKYFNNIEHFD